MIASVTMTTDGARPGSCAAVARPLIAILDELRMVVVSLTNDQYTTRLGSLFADSSVGAHVRHCLDHARAVIDGWEAREVDYDHRERGTDIEISTTAAAAELTRLIGNAQRLCGHDARREVRVVVMPTRSGATFAVDSTLGRELAFVVSHTIHHNATVRGMVLSLGLSVPPSLGYAPSTLAHRDAH